MLGNVSPMVLNKLNSSFSPGIVRETKPAAFIAELNTSPDAPANSVRSRSKNAAPRDSLDVAECGCLLGLIATA